MPCVHYARCMVQRWTVVLIVFEEVIFIFVLLRHAVQSYANAHFANLSPILLPERSLDSQNTGQWVHTLKDGFDAVTTQFKNSSLVLVDVLFEAFDCGYRYLGPEDRHGARLRG